MGSTVSEGQKVDVEMNSNGLRERVKTLYKELWNSRVLECMSWFGQRVGVSEKDWKQEITGVMYD